MGQIPLETLHTNSPVHVVDTLEQLVHETLDLALWQVLAPAFDHFVDVALHQLENQRKPPTRCITAEIHTAACDLRLTCTARHHNALKNLKEFHHMNMRRQPPKSLNLTQIVHLVNAVKLGLHALDCHVLPRFDALCLQNLREGALSLLTYEPVLVHTGLRRARGTRSSQTDQATSVPLVAPFHTNLAVARKSTAGP